VATTNFTYRWTAFRVPDREGEKKFDALSISLPVIRFTGRRNNTMRFMMIVKANKDSEAGVMPGRELLEAMGKFNEEMARAGVLVAGEGLQASSKGARVRFSPGRKPTVTDGPFAETRELIAGYWLIDVPSKAEAIAWASRAPAPHGPDRESEIEIRQMFEAADFGPEAEPQTNRQP
jgi:hypothetical protein